MEKEVKDKDDLIGVEMSSRVNNLNIIVCLYDLN